MLKARDPCARAVSRKVNHRVTVAISVAARVVAFFACVVIVTFVVFARVVYVAAAVAFVLRVVVTVSARVVDVACVVACVGVAHVVVVARVGGDVGGVVAGGSAAFPITIPSTLSIHWVRMKVITFSATLKGATLKRPSNNPSPPFEIATISIQNPKKCLMR